MKTIDKIIILACLIGALTMSWTLYRQYLDEKDCRLTFQSNKVIEGDCFKYLSNQEKKSYLKKSLKNKDSPEVRVSLFLLSIKFPNLFESSEGFSYIKPCALSNENCLSNTIEYFEKQKDEKNIIYFTTNFIDKNPQLQVHAFYLMLQSLKNRSIKDPLLISEVKNKCKVVLISDDRTYQICQEIIKNY